MPGYDGPGLCKIHTEGRVDQGAGLEFPKEKACDPLITSRGKGKVSWVQIPSPAPYSCDQLYSDHAFKKCKMAEKRIWF